MADKKKTPRRRLTLMEAYGSFSDHHLKDLATRIKKIGRQAESSSSAGASPQLRVVSPVDDSIDDQIAVQIADSIESVNDSITDQITVQIADQIGYSVGEPVDEFEPPRPALLTENQAILYFCLKILNGNVTSLNRISQETHISVYTLKSCLAKLRQENLLLYGGMTNCGGRIGFTAKTINRPIVLRGNKNKFYSRLKAIKFSNLLFVAPLDANPPGTSEILPQFHPLDNLLDHLPDGHYSSSSYINNKTTTTKSEFHNSTNDDLAAIAQVLATHPELGYWRQKKLTPQQIKKWMELTGASLESMIQSLCHCRFEMVEMDLEQQREIKNVFNWFYRIIERAGFYPRPKDYQSFEEKQIAMEKKLLAEKQERARVLAELRRQKIAAEREIAFQEMLADPSSELYQLCFSRLNKFTQETKLVSLFERAMRDAFEQVMDEREQELLAAHPPQRPEGPPSSPGGGD
jgi:hypothetical protein